MHFEGILRPRLSNPATALGPIAKWLSAADLAMVNLETAITTGGTPAPNKQFTFRAPATAFKALKAAGVDVASMANNHGMDYMEGGFRDSLAAIKRTRFPTVGIGKNADEAYKPYRVTITSLHLLVQTSICLPLAAYDLLELLLQSLFPYRSPGAALDQYRPRER